MKDILLDLPYIVAGIFIGYIIVSIWDIKSELKEIKNNIKSKKGGDSE